MFKKVLLAAVATGLTLAGASAANAADGCGPGFHRGYYGHCRPNGPGYGPGPAVVAVGPVGLRIGGFYAGRGYWDGHRYWQHRDGWRGGWRYR